jgi:hypothetical protein
LSGPYALWKVEIHRVHPPQLAARDALADEAHPLGEAVRQVDGEERSAARAASTTRRTSSAVRPSGFWQNTATPASSARIDCSACSALGEAITIPSSPISSSASSPSTTSAPGAVSRAAAVISGDGSDTAATTPKPARAMASMRFRPIQPTPRKPSRGVRECVSA